MPSLLAKLLRHSAEHAAQQPHHQSRSSLEHTIIFQTISLESSLYGGMHRCLANRASLLRSKTEQIWLAGTSLGS